MKLYVAMARWTTCRIPITILPTMRGRRCFSAAQYAGSRSLGHALARRVDFTPFTCLLDLGGGSGAYTVAILRRYPHLRAILFDFPQVGRLAEAVMRQEGLTDRVHIVGGDYEHDALPAGPDVVLWSGNLHASSPESCRRVLTRLHALLPPGGMVLMHDYMLDDSHSGPLIPALLALHLSSYPSTGRCIAAQNCAPCWRKPGSRRCR